VRNPAWWPAVCSVIVLGATLGAPRGVAEGPGDIAQHLAAGDTALAEKDWARAQHAFTSALWIDPELPTAHYGLGQAQMGQQQFAAAAESFGNCRNALRRLLAHGQTVAVHTALARAHRLKALEDYVVFLQRQTTTAFIGGQDANFTAVTRLEKVISQLQRDHASPSSLAKVPPIVSFLLGSAQLQAGQLQEAEASLLEVVGARKDFGPAHNNLAVIYLKTGRLPEARTEVESAEECGFTVHPQLKKDLERAVAAAESPGK
jgi:Tfp pilus assembly protein PilF